MRIGYFGGSFDPPHRGHLVVACAAADRFSLDRVLLAPAGRQPLKPGGSSAPYDDRIAMVEALATLDPRLHVSTLDAPRTDGQANFTVNTLRQLRAQMQPDDQLFAIAGADAFAGVEQWREHDALWGLAEWIVVTRPGQDAERAVQAVQHRQQMGRIHLLGGVEEDVSATEIRARLQAGKPCDRLVPAPVLAYIAAHGLYRAPAAV